MITAKITRKTNNIEKLLKKIQRLQTAKVESGYFVEQGFHPTAEMPYTDLYAIHAFGLGNFPARDVRLAATQSMKRSSFSNLITKELRNYFYKNDNLVETLDDFGEEITRISQDFFGDTSVLASNAPSWASFKGKDEPLVYDGFLRDMWSWKTSENNSIQSV